MDKGGCLLFILIPFFILLAAADAFSDSIYKGMAVLILFGGLYGQLLYLLTPNR